MTLYVTVRLTNSKSQLRLYQCYHRDNYPNTTKVIINELRTLHLMKNPEFNYYISLFYFLERIEHFKTCPKLRSVNLSGNTIDYISNLEFCNQLWRVDLSNNQVNH